MKHAQSEPVEVVAALAADAKHGPDSLQPCEHCAALFRCCYAAITVACTGAVDRRTIERRLRLGQRTLDDHLAGSKRQMLPFDAVARMIFDPRVLGREAQGVLISMLLDQLGVHTSETLVRARAAELGVETLDVFDTAGLLADEVRESQDPDSPGGRDITPMEHERIGARARAVSIEASQLMPGRAEP